MTLHRFISRPLASATLIAMLLATLPAVAAPVDERRARQLFDEGTAAYRSGDFERAAQAFEAASRLSTDPVYVYNLAQALRRNGKARDALRAFEKYLEMAPNAPNRSTVERLIADLRTQVAPLPAPAPAPPAPSEPAPVNATRPSATPTEGGTGRPAAFWAGAGLSAAGVVLVGAGIGMGASARSLANDLSNAPANTPFTQQYADKEATGQNRAKIAYALIGVGGAAALGGVVLMILKRSPSSESRAQILPTAGGVLAHVRF